MPSKNKILMLGDMLELGDHSEAEHKNMSEWVDGLDVSAITLVGPEFMKFQGKTRADHFPDIESAIEFYRKNPVSDSVILIKGSRGIKMEKILESLV